MALYAYKDTSFKRGHRVQNIEETFAKGMSYTSAPLAEGYNRVLVNLDMQDSGNSVTPRLGLRADSYMYNGWPNVGSDEDNNLFEIVEAHAFDDRKLLSTIWYTGRNNEDKIFGKYVTAGTVYCDTFDYPGYGSQDHADTLNGGRLTHTAHLMSNIGARIHGIEVLQKIIPETEPSTTPATDAETVPETDTPTTPEPVPNTLGIHVVGTWAYNNNYYFYDDEGKCCVYSYYTEDETTENAIGATVYIHHKNDPKLDVYTPKVLTAKEAVTYGYNMLLANPYQFANTAGGNVLEFTGLLPYVNDALCMTPVQNQDIHFVATGTIPLNKKYKFVAEWSSMNNTSWNTIKEWTADTGADISTLEIAFDFAPPVAEAIIRISAYPVTENVAAEIADSVLAVGFSFQKAGYSNTINCDKKQYSIHQASGICYWKNRIVAWGVPEDDTILFISDVNDPTYFPYPNNIETFTSSIQYCTPFGDDLLVFTADALYIITLADDGASWTCKCLQRNLSIAAWDVHLVQTVKNMLFFKSGNYYYMVVPKSGSLTGELTIADVSKPMRGFFDNFKTSVLEVLNNTYMPEAEYTDFSIAHYYNYLSKDSVHNVYMLIVPDIRETHDTYVNLDVIYDTVNRTWRVYTYGSSAKLVPHNTSSTQDTMLVSKFQFGVDNKHTGVQHLAWSVEREDMYLQNNDARLAADDEYIVVSEDQKQSITGNRQLIDTGYREHASNFKKRYRELQFIINNISLNALQFYVSFLIDGALRKSWYGYEIVQDTDPTSPTYGVISVHRVLLPSVSNTSGAPVTPSTTVLDNWMLDMSAFPDNGYWKCRVAVSGKGYVPRMLINSPNAKIFELLNISWVYRTLYSR